MIRNKIELLKKQMPIEMRLKQVKQVCVRLLKAFADVCAKYNLNGGSTAEHCSEQFEMVT